MAAREKKKKYSYIRHPFSKGGWWGFGLSLIAFAATQAVVWHAVSTSGDVGMLTAAVGLSSILISITALIFCVGAFREKNKNYIFAVTGIVITIIVLLEWVYIL